MSEKCPTCHHAIIESEATDQITGKAVKMHKRTEPASDCCFCGCCNDDLEDDEE